MWPFKKKPEPILFHDTKAHYESIFGPGSWDELEKGVMERMKKDNPYLYKLITENF